MKRLSTVLIISAALWSQDSITSRVHTFMKARMAKIQETFFIYEDGDSAFGTGIPSGLFASTEALRLKVKFDTACVYDSKYAKGCAPFESAAIDRTARKQVLAINWPPMAALDFAGLTIERPENFGRDRTASAETDLRGATRVLFRAKSQTPGCRFRVAVRGSETPWLSAPDWQDFAFSFSDLNPPLRRLTGVHALFTAVSNGANCPNGGTVLFDDIRLDPVPILARKSVGFPLANDTWGVVPAATKATRMPAIYSDQVNRNIAPIYESSLALLFFLDQKDFENARMIADAFVEALRYSGVPGNPTYIPPAPKSLDYRLCEYGNAPVPPITKEPTEGAMILASSYQGGRLFTMGDPFVSSDYNVRNGGFTLAEPTPEVPPGRKEVDCGLSRYCLVLDGTTGGNNAFAMLALLGASRVFEPDKPGRYLRAARSIGKWIDLNLLDTDPASYGGFFLGWNDEGQISKGIFLTGKSVENNGDLFIAYRLLAERERQTGDEMGTADRWIELSKVAAAFVLEMFDPVEGRFYSGTVPIAQKEIFPGLKFANSDCQTGSGCSAAPGCGKGHDMLNTFDFLDAQTFTTLPLARFPEFASIDWNRPIEWALVRQKTSVTFLGLSLDGFQLVVPEPGVYDKGVSFEFTGQMVVAMKLLQEHYNHRRFEEPIALYLQSIARAQREAPYGDIEHLGIVAAVVDEKGPLADGPKELACLRTPFQCIAPRVGLAATLWGSFAETGLNPLGAPRQ